MTFAQPARQPETTAGEQCVFCADTPTVPWIEDGGYTGRRCSGCGLVFVAPRPSREEIDRLYAEDAAHLPAEMFLTSYRTLAARLFARKTVQILRREVAPGRLLEIGPGNANVLAEARRHGFVPFAVEASPTQAEFIREVRGIPCVEHLDRVEELGETQFDVVFHRDVISHFYDPIDEFRRINRLLAPGGFHVFETGNIGDVSRRFLRYYRSFQYPDHLFFYSTRSLEMLLARTGLDLVRIYRYSLMPEKLQTAALDGARRLIPRPRPSATTRPDATTPAAPARSSHSRLGAQARRALDVSVYASRFGLGAVRHDAHEPQTLIVFARKLATD